MNILVPAKISALFTIAKFTTIMLRTVFSSSTQITAGIAWNEPDSFCWHQRPTIKMFKYEGFSLKFCLENELAFREIVLSFGLFTELGLETSWPTKNCLLQFCQ